MHSPRSGVVELVWHRGWANQILLHSMYVKTSVQRARRWSLGMPESRRSHLRHVADGTGLDCRINRLALCRLPSDVEMATANQRADTAPPPTTRQGAGAGRALRVGAETPVALGGRALKGSRRLSYCVLKRTTAVFCAARNDLPRYQGVVV